MISWYNIHQTWINLVLWESTKEFEMSFSHRNGPPLYPVELLPLFPPVELPPRPPQLGPRAPVGPPAPAPVASLELPLGLPSPDQHWEWLEDQLAVVLLGFALMLEWKVIWFRNSLVNCLLDFHLLHHRFFFAGFFECSHFSLRTACPKSHNDENTNISRERITNGLVSDHQGFDFFLNCFLKHLYQDFLLLIGLRTTSKSKQTWLCATYLHTTMLLFSILSLSSQQIHEHDHVILYGIMINIVFWHVIRNYLHTHEYVHTMNPYIQ